MLDKKVIKTVGFDLDECLYPSSPEINNRIRNRIAGRILEKHTELKSIERARKYFEYQYKKTGSGRKVLITAGYAPEEAGKIIDHAISEAEIIDIISNDPVTSRIIRKLSENYLIYLLTSSPEKSATEKLNAIGINPSFFSYRICSDNCKGISKQERSAFEYAIKLTRIQAQNHVYVGNSAKSDIIPAKSLGMQTIGVWSNIPEADISIEHIHKLEEILL